MPKQAPGSTTSLSQHFLVILYSYSLKIIHSRLHRSYILIGTHTPFRRPTSIPLEPRDCSIPDISYIFPKPLIYSSLSLSDCFWPHDGLLSLNIPLHATRQDIALPRIQDLMINYLSNYLFPSFSPFTPVNFSSYNIWEMSKN